MTDDARISDNQGEAYDRSEDVPVNGPSTSPLIGGNVTPTFASCQPAQNQEEIAS
jgi:hypothetical protein